MLLFVSRIYGESDASGENEKEKKKKKLEGESKKFPKAATFLLFPLFLRCQKRKLSQIRICPFFSLFVRVRMLGSSGKKKLSPLELSAPSSSPPEKRVEM